MFFTPVFTHYDKRRKYYFIPILYTSINLNNEIFHYFQFIILQRYLPTCIFIVNIMNINYMFFFPKIII